MSALPCPDDGPQQARRQHRAAAVRAALDRAHRIATVAAEALVRSQGRRTHRQYELLLAACQLDQHLRDCIEHLAWHGRAVSRQDEFQNVVVVFGDFTLGGG